MGSEDKDTDEGDKSKVSLLRLWDAARDGDAAKVSTLLSTQGAESFINCQNSRGATPLHAAAWHGREAVTKQLLAARCSVDLQDVEGATPLHNAALNGHEAVTKQLIAARCSVDLQTENGSNALHVAAHLGHAAVTKQLLAARCNVDFRANNGFTPLHAAAFQGHVDVTKQLLSARCNVHLQANSGLTALQLAERQGHAGVATLIQADGLENNTIGSDELPETTEAENRLNSSETGNAKVCVPFSLPMTKKEFNEDRQAKFRQALANVAGVKIGDVTVDKITETMAGRATSIRIDSSVAVTGGKLADSETVKTLMTADRINAELSKVIAQAKNTSVVYR